MPSGTGRAMHSGYPIATKWRSLGLAIWPFDGYQVSAAGISKRRRFENDVNQFVYENEIMIEYTSLTASSGISGWSAIKFLFKCR